jgi:putative transposase
VATLDSERFCDLTPGQVWAILLDEGTYLCSISMMYSLLRERDEVRERRRIARHPLHEKPQLVARGPNQVWSWDITKLRGPEKWTWFYLYVILDIFSRYVVGWLVAPREVGTWARDLIAQSLADQGINRDQLIIHADRGTSMTSKPVVQLLADLGVTRSHSRPHQSNDNPYSEAQFKTLKYCPGFPDRFGSLAHAQTFSDAFFWHYNHAHHHSALGLHTAADVHHGRAGDLQTKRADVLTAAYHAHPERFRRPPTPPKLPTIAWINQPPEVIVTR